ncbi:MAG TPA: transporter [Chitinophagaceae bacterium]
MKKIFSIISVLTIFIAGPLVTNAQQEVGHFAPGVLNIRDFAMPEPGFYGVVYNYFYSTNRLNDDNGNKINSVTIKPGPGPGTVVNIDVDVNVYALAPTFIWISKWKLLGAKYGAYISPSFSNTSIGASLKTTTGSGRSAEGSQFAVADLFFQPLWLGWAKKKWDFAFGYGFYAPVGKYSTETVSLPVIGNYTAEASDNIGLGFWTHQVQGAAAYYPWEDKRMAIATALTYEIHGNKKDFDLKPGENLTFNWGVSQYLPLKKDMTLLLELGPSGYNSWQVSDDKGEDAADSPVLDQVHALGLQVGLTHVPWNAALNLRYYSELSSKNRFQGNSFGVNLAIKF